MRIAVLSDIHGNLPALHTVAAHIDDWMPDHVYVNGDIINRGASPMECIEFVQEKQQNSGWNITRGNHEDFVISCRNPVVAQTSPLLDVHKCAVWTYERVYRQVDVLAAWPQQLKCIGPDGGDIRITHASMQGNQKSIFIDTPVQELRSKINPAPAVFCTAHTHHAWIRFQDGTLVVNSGSVGTPFDGDASASYAQLTWRKNYGSFGGWSSKIVRIDYDRNLTEHDFERSAFLTEAGPVARIMYTEWKLARSLLPHWEKQYREEVLAGTIATDDAVEQFLQNVN